MDNFMRSQACALLSLMDRPLALDQFSKLMKGVVLSYSMNSSSGKSQVIALPHNQWL
jgi:hypothetical protein